MKTVSTKLDESDFSEFQNRCNQSGLCASEWLRNLIRNDFKQGQNSLQTLSEPTQETPATAHAEPKFPIIDGKPQPIVEFVFD